VNLKREETINSSERNTIISTLGQKFTNYWKTGKNGKLIIIVATILIIIGLCCAGTITLSSILPKTTDTATPIPPIVNTSIPTSTLLPSSTETLSITSTPLVTATQVVQYQIVAHRGVIYYIVIDPQYNSDRNTLGNVGLSICGTEAICQVWFFNDLATATTSSQVVDATLAIAIYGINTNTGYKEMRVCALGDCK
jgi:hypothetical protein